MHDVGLVEDRVEVPAAWPLRRVRHVAVWQCAEPLSRQRVSGRAEAGTARPAAPAARRVLVVDDETSVRLICRFNLSAAGIDVREAEDGEQALAAIASEPPELVLLDVMMPRLDGWQVAERLAGSRRTRELPIVFLTARATDADREHAARLGAVGYIVKPFDPIGLAARLERLLERLEGGEREQLQRELLERRE